MRKIVLTDSLGKSSADLKKDTVQYEYINNFIYINNLVPSLKVRLIHDGNHLIKNVHKVIIQ